MPDNAPKALRRDIEQLKTGVNAVQNEVQSVSNQLQKLLRGADSQITPKAGPSVSSSPNKCPKSDGSGKPSAPKRRLKPKAWRQIKRIFLKKDRLERGAYLAGIVYAVITWYQWHAQITANDLAHTGLQLQQRAYLTYGNIDQIPAGIKVHLSNIGHVPGTVVGGSAHYYRVTFPGNVNRASFSAAVPGKIVVGIGPESDAALIFTLPRLDDSLLKTGHEIMALDATVKYDTGFKSTDTFDIHISYDWEAAKWVHVNNGTNVYFVHPPSTSER